MLRYVVAALVIAGGGFAAFHFLQKPASAAKAAAPKPPTVSSVVLPPLTTNLADTDQVRLVQVGLTATLVGDQAQAAWAAHLAAIQDATIGALRTRTSAQLNGKQAMTQLAADLESAYNKILGDAGKVTKIYFTQFVVQ
ncbi:MAG TPA: flagellar basal body-associated FliL family protein [Bacillota bacterium]|nr:flagellar basal body-associated FliL family protein [Bacillota bacterium]